MPHSIQPWSKLLAAAALTTGGLGQPLGEATYATGYIRPPAITGSHPAEVVPSKSIAPTVSLDWIPLLKSDNIHALPSAAHIAPLTAGLNALLQQAVPQNDYRFISNLLTLMQPVEMRSDVMVAVLRTLFPVRTYLSLHYRTLLRQVSTELDKRGMDAKKILRGLI